MSSSDEDRPPPPARDPLLDDPAFAELVGPPPVEPAFAEPVEEPIESLPVAKVIRPKAVAVPPAPATKLAPNISMPVPVETEPPKPNWFMACGVIGCVGVLIIAAIVTLIWIAITLLSNIGDKIGKPTKRADATTPKAQRGPLAPTVLANDIEVPLAGRVDAVARGGGGRFLLMRTSRTKEIHVFDANQAQIVYKIPARESGTRFVAGSDKIFVCDPIDKKLYRYDLFSGEFEAEEKLPNAALHTIAIGAGSSGPLYLLTSTASKKLRILHFDSATLKQLKEDTFTFAVDFDASMLARASDNGSVLGVSCKDGAVAIAGLGGSNPTARLLTPERSPKPKWAIPSPDGQFFYTPRGVFGTGGNPFLGTRSGFHTFPVSSGNDWFLSLDETEEDVVSGTPRRYPAGKADLAQFTALEKVFLPGNFPANEPRGDDLLPADRIHYWPSAGLAAVLPTTPASEPAMLKLYKLPVLPVK